MVHRTLCGILVFVVAACATTESNQVRLGHITYALVTGAELRSSFVGKKIRYLEPQIINDIVIISSPRCDAFYPDGQYVTCGDRHPRPTGTYEMQEDRVCIDSGSRAMCIKLFRSQGGKYLLRDPRYGAALKPVSFVPISDETVPPF